MLKRWAPIVVLVVVNVVQLITAEVAIRKLHTKIASHNAIFVDLKAELEACKLASLGQMIAEFGARPSCWTGEKWERVTCPTCDEWRAKKRRIEELTSGGWVDDASACIFACAEPAPKGEACIRCCRPGGGLLGEDFEPWAPKGER